MTESHGAHLPAAVAASRRRRFMLALRSFYFSIIANVLLCALKGLVGVVGHSEALLADAVHSGADLAAALVGLSSTLVARHPADAKHPYGHGRAEALAANFAAMVVGIAGVLVLWDTAHGLLRQRGAPPSTATLLVAAVVTVVKLGLFGYTARTARITRSKAVHADARDHLTDVASGVIVVAGIAAARFGVRWLDPLAGLVVGCFILYTAQDVFRSAVHELMDTSLAPEVRSAVIEQALAVPGIAITGVAGRMIGDLTLVELHGEVDGSMSVAEASRIVDEVKSRLLAHVTAVHHVVVELNSGVDEPEALRLTGSDRGRPAS